jgi:dienelactone hydrolase
MIFDTGKPRVRSGRLAARLLAASATAQPAAALAIIAVVSTAAVVGAQNAGDAVTVASKPHRPQEEAIAKSTRPYTETDVSFSNEGPVRLAGTLSVPNGKGPFPAVLLIAASGPEGRDENAGGHLVFVVLADYLLRQGVAVLRYDKRGVGKSTGNFETASFDDLVSDAGAAFRYLKARPEADPRRLGTIGHSEGGSIAPAVAAADQDVAFVVAMAGSGLSGEFRMTEILVYMAQDNGASPEQQARIRALCHQVLRAAEGTQDDAVAGKRIAALIDETSAAKVLSSEQVTTIREIMTVKLARQLLNDNPISYLKNVKVPVLALVGSLDRTVPAGPYVEAMRPVLAAIPGSKLEVLPRLNHLMQTAETGSPREFNIIEETISPVALKTIGDWVTGQVKRPR